MEIVGVGIAVIDVIQDVEVFPGEDSKVDFSHIELGWAQIREHLLIIGFPLGGNATNALVRPPFPDYDASCHWIGTTTDPAHDGDAAFVHGDLHAFGVDTTSASILSTGSMPVSYILASNATGSRTIIHHRDLPELSVDAFRQRFTHLVERCATATTTTTSGTIVDSYGALHDPERRFWVHFEGRNLDNVLEMIHFVRSDHGQRSGNKGSGHSISLEVEALRNDWPQIQRLLKLVDIAFVSKEYIRQKLQLPTAAAFFQVVRTLWGPNWRPRAVICPWGRDGVYYMDIRTTTTPWHTEHHVSTEPLEYVVDSVGAGDSFIGATLAALTRGLPLDQAVRIACHVATAKCSQQGFRLPATLRDPVIAQLTCRQEE